MILEVGKTYITANGREATILDLNFDDSAYPVLFKSKNLHGEVVTNRCSLDGSNPVHEGLRIVKEKPKSSKIKVYVLKFTDYGLFEPTGVSPSLVKDVKDARLFT
jgi:hypothetical protein